MVQYELKTQVSLITRSNVTKQIIVSITVKSIYYIIVIA